MRYVLVVMIVGTTNAVVARMLLRLNLKLSACFSLTMPNDYVLMRGFEVDADAVRDQKLAAAVDQLDKIEARMRVGSTDAAGLYNPGRMAWLKTFIWSILFSGISSVDTSVSCY